MHQGHLSALDAAFLYLETPEMPMHVGGMYLLQLPEDYEGDFYDNFKAMIASRLHLAPVFTRKLALMPFELANPLWIEDDDIDLDYHIRRIVLPKPGTREQLEKYVGRLHSSLLDRSRPLWEFYVIEGVGGEGSRQLAFYSKVHHAALDGQAAMKLASTVLDVSAVPRRVKPLPARPGRRQYQLGIGELLLEGATHGVSQVARLAALAPSLAVGAAKAAAKAAAGAAAVVRNGVAQRALPKLPSWPKEWVLGPRTHFNVAITNQRSFASTSLPLAQVKATGKALDATINDVVLALCSGALRRYLDDYGKVPDKSLIAAVPISTRAADDESQTNQVLMLPVSLASNLKDPLARLRAIQASAEKVKALTGGSMKAKITFDLPSLGVPWLMSGLVSLFGKSRIANAMPPIANVVISNVPGPQMPLFMAGACVLTMSPVSIPVHGVAINITVQSYDGHLDFGITACRRAVPDVKTIASYIEGALAELALAAPQTSDIVPALAAPPSDLPAVAAPKRKAASRTRPSRRHAGHDATVHA